MFVAETSTHKVGQVAQTLMGVAKSASTISPTKQEALVQLAANTRQIWETLSRSSEKPG